MGFPGETDADFADTLDLVRQAEFDAAFTFIYSARSGTPAATMPGQVPLEIKKERLQHLMAVQNASSLRRNRALVGQVVEVLADGPSKNSTVWNGRTRTDKLVLWPTEGREYTPGERVPIKVEAAQTWLVKGKAVTDG